jgi:hypothetical protein
MQWRISHGFMYSTISDSNSGTSATDKKEAGDMGIELGQEGK